MRKIIGISGFAGSGKDEFFNLINEASGGKCVRFALADILKLELRDFIQTQYNIDILSCDRQQKENLRGFLVFHGKMKRYQTRGRYWVDKLQETMNNYPDKTKTGVITDIRYAEFPKDEFFWLKRELNGILVHIAKFSIDKGGNQVFAMPPNREEASNDPILLRESDYKLFWRDCGGNLDALKTENLDKINDFVLKYVN